MAHIYAEMLVVDQWVLEHSKYRTQADTSLVYEPIFQKYGYTTEDYRASVQYYMNDPERYSRILRTTSEILEKQLKELKSIKSIEDRLRSRVPYKIDPNRLYYGRSKDRFWEYGDSVSVALDSLTPVYELGFHDLSDTLSVKDSVVVNDPVVVKDSVAVKDSVVVKDSIVVKKLAPLEKPISVKQGTLKPNIPQRLYSTTLDSLKRK